MWKRGGSGIIQGGGVAQLWKAIAGQTISCVAGSSPFFMTYYATVDVNGVFYLKIGAGSWQHVSSAYDGSYGRTVSVSLAGLSVIDNSGIYACSAVWT